MARKSQIKVVCTKNRPPSHVQAYQSHSLANDLAECRFVLLQTRGQIVIEWRCQISECRRMSAIASANVDYPISNDCIREAATICKYETATFCNGFKESFQEEFIKYSENGLA